jgi:D-3-phosphoglycerate dehydrogenase
MEVISHDPYVPDDALRQQGVEPVGLDALFRRADVVSCHLPWSAETFHLIGPRHIELMKPSAIFVNTGRGKVVDEAALIGALEAGRLAGAGLDVLEQEPPEPANPLLRMPNVTVSPHMASVSDVSAVARRQLLGRQIAQTLQGRVPVGVVNPGVLPRWRGQAGVAAST